MNNYKILQINTVCNSGSTGRIAEEIGLAVKAKGWKSYVVYARNGQPSHSLTIRIGNEWDICWHGVITRLFDRHGLGSKRATKKLVREIDKIQPDIVHIHNLHGYYLNYPILFDYLSQVNIPVVWTLHDCWAFTGHCSYFSLAGCDRWRTECFQCPLKKSYPASLLFDRSRKNYKDKKRFFTSLSNQTFVSVSAWLQKLVQASFLGEYPVKLIHNGIDTTVFSPKDDCVKKNVRKKYDLENRFVIIGVANGWYPQKGLPDFLTLNTRLDHTNFVIMLVGLTESQLKDMPPDIIAIPRTDSTDDLAALYATADVYLNLTYDDNFPTTNLEALSCGTPVVTYRTGGSVEAVNNETGFVVEQGDMDELVRLVKKIHKDGKYIYTNACRQRASMYFRKEDRYAEYLQLYENLLSEKR